MNLALSIIYLIGTITFVIGLKMLGHPETAKKGNLISAVGMGIAILGTLFLHDFEVSNIIYTLVITAILLGGIIGWIIAVKVEMTKMPELVSLFNGFGGGSALLIGLVEFTKYIGVDESMKPDAAITTTILSAIIIGSITFTGSIIAWAKLNGTMNDIRLPKYNLINNLIAIGLVVFGAYIVMVNTDSLLLIYLLLFASLVYGVLFVIPIGGADKTP